MDVVDLFVECERRCVPSAGRLADLLGLARASGDPFSRHTFPRHVTASACVVDAPRSRVLMILSPKFGRWMLPGGHIDSGEMPHEAALREFREECGTAGEGVATDAPWPANIDVHWIAANPRRGEPRHQHVDFQFIFTCAEADALCLHPDPREAAEIGWRNFDALRIDYAVLHGRLVKGF